MIVIDIQMRIDLRDNIVILDEAHNIEDTCRDVAGVNFRDDDLAIALKDCTQLLEQHPRYLDAYIAIRLYLLDVVKFLKGVAIEEKTNVRTYIKQAILRCLNIISCIINDSCELCFDRAKISNINIHIVIIDIFHNKKCMFQSDQLGMNTNYWQGAEFLELLNIGNVGRSRFPAFLDASKVAIQDYNDMKEEFRPDRIKPTITRETKCILEHLCFAMYMLTSEDFVNDYRACIIETIENKKTVSSCEQYGIITIATELFSSQGT